MMRKFWFMTVMAAFGTAWAGDGDPDLVQKESDNAWHFRIGPVLSPRVRVNVSGSRVALPRLRAAGQKSGMSGGTAADPSAGAVGRQYADGYVKPDEGTSDPDSLISGLTWNWGANDVPLQYSDGRMEFRTDVARWSENSSSTSFGSGSGSESERDFLVGVEAMGGWAFFDNRTFDAAVDAGFRFYGSGYLESESKYGTSVSTTRNAYRYVDSYDASGWSGVPSGSYAGTPGGPGRLLGAEPTRREELAGSTHSTENYFSSGSTKLNYRIWDFRLGPTLGWQVTDDLTIRGGIYGLLGLVDATLKTDAAGSNGAYGSKTSTCGAVFGMAFGLSAQYNITDSLFLMGGVEYDWWTDSVDLAVGGADAEIELSDMSVSLGLGIEF